MTNPKNLPADGRYFIPHERAIVLDKCDFSYSCAAADKILTDLRRRAVPSSTAELLVTVGIYSTSFTGLNTLQIGNLLPNFMRRRTRVDGTEDNADISQSQTSSDDRLLSHATLGRVKCRTQTASVQIAKRFEPNTVLCTHNSCY